MKNIVYNMHPQGPDEEVVTIGRRNLVLHTAPTSLFGSLVTTLAARLGQPISEATRTLADLGEIETVSAQKEVGLQQKGEVQKGH